MLSVIVPVRNEAENIIPLIEEIHAALAGRSDFEVIYVDDGSTDDTPQILAEAAGRFGRLRVLRHGTSCGQSAAVWTGGRAAKGEWIITLDGDGQNDPADIPALLSVVEGAGGVVKMAAGIRRRRQDNWVRRMSSRIANGVRSRLLGDGVSDTGCGLKVIERETFLALPFFDHAHRFLPALVIRAGGEIRCVEVNHRPRQAGRSNYGLADRLWVGITDLVGVMWLQRRNSRPIIDPPPSQSED
ncbi:MAG: glycosyltransferase family 2 protein [Alphaproteobacteria bacterium]